MGKRSESLGEDRHGVGNKIREAEVVNSEDNDGMEMGVEAGDISRKDRDGLRDGDELSRLCLYCFCHIRGSIMSGVSQTIWLLFKTGVHKETRPDWDRFSVIVTTPCPWNVVLMINSPNSQNSHGLGIVVRAEVEE